MSGGKTVDPASFGHYARFSNGNGKHAAQRGRLPEVPGATSASPMVRAGLSFRGLLSPRFRQAFTCAAPPRAL